MAQTATDTETPTDTPTMTATDTGTDTPTETATNTATQTPTNTVTQTSTVTPTQTATDTATNTATQTPSNTATQTPSNTATSTATNTATNTVPCGDAITFGGQNSMAGTNKTFDLPITITAGSVNPILIVHIQQPNHTTAVNYVSYNGVAMSQAVSYSSANGYSDYIYYALASQLPTDGAVHNITVNQSASFLTIIGAMWFTNVSQVPLANFAKAAKASAIPQSLALTTTAANSVIAGFCVGYGNKTVASSQTSEWTAGANPVARGDYYTKATAGSYTMAYTLSGAEVADILLCELLLDNCAATATPTYSPTTMPCAITFGTANSSNFATNTTFNLPLTITAGAVNPILIVHVRQANLVTTINSATFNGVNMTLVGGAGVAGTTYKEYTYYLLGSKLPTDGVGHNITIVQNANIVDSIGAMWFSNADQVTGIGNYSSCVQAPAWTNPSCGITTSTNGSVIVGNLVGYGAGALATVTPQTQAWITGANPNDEGDYMQTTNAGFYQTNYTMASQDGDLQAVEILPANCSATNTPTSTPTVVSCAIAYGGGAGAYFATNTYNYTLPITITAGSVNPILLVHVMQKNKTTTITSATFNGVALTSAGAPLASANGYEEYTYYMLGPQLPVDGNPHLISIYQNAQIAGCVGAEWFTGADQVTGVEAYTTYAQTVAMTGPSIGVTTLTNSSMIVGNVISYGAGVITPMSPPRPRDGLPPRTRTTRRTISPVVPRETTG